MLAKLMRRAGIEAREMQPWGDWNPSSLSNAGIAVNQTNALQLLTVHGSAALISDTIATLPVDVFRRRGDVQTEAVAPPWLDQPNDEDDIVDFTVKFLMSLLFDGNAYVTYSLDRSFVTQQVAVLDPTVCDVRVQDGEKQVWVLGERFSGNLKHVKGISKPGALKGVSPVEAARQSIGLGLAAQEFGARFFSNGATMSGVIQHPDKVDIEVAREYAQAFGRDHRGLANAWTPGVLYGGATWQSLSVTPEQSQFLETRAFTASEIAAQMFLLDPTLLGIPVQTNSLTYANLEQRGIHLVTFSLLRWIIRLERLFTSLLPQGEFCKLNVDGLMRADLKTRYEAYDIGIDAGFYDKNEARAKENLAPVEEAVQFSQAEAEVISILIRAGFTADSVIDAVTTGDPTKLTHTGQLPVTVQTEGT